MEEFEIPVFKKSSSEFSDEFSKKLKEFKLNEDEVKKLFRAYKRQNEIDFFIHKNAKSFLEEQFDLFFYNYLFKDSKIQNWQDSAINKLLALRNIALFIIEKIADFENELKAIWLKPKFAKQTNFVFTLNMIKNPSEFINDKQIKEWQDLGLVTGDDYSKNPFLPLDTKHLDEKSKIKLLSEFDNLDEVLNGELIKADNFQALNTIMPKYKGKIDLIYIDPPFNTGSDFAYVDRFQDSTWLTLRNNRLEIAKNLLSDKGSFYLHLDHNADYYGRILLNDTFGKENFVNDIVWKRKGGSANPDDQYDIATDTILFVSKTENYIFNKQFDLSSDEVKKYIKERFNNFDENGKQFMKSPIVSPNYRENLKYEYKGYKAPPNGWSIDISIMKKWDAENKLYFPKDGDRIYRKIYLDEYRGQPLSNLWTDIFVINPVAKERINSDENLTQKPEALLARIIKASSDENSRILDYHLGSGTTCATALKLGRKFIGVEMGEHFYSVIIPRIKKCLAGVQSGISKECEYKGGGAFKYYELESYEEALNNCEYEVNSSKILDYRKSKKLIKELNKEKSIDLEMSGYRKDFDIFTSYSNISGLKIKRIFSKNNQNFCEYENGEVLNDKQISLSKHEKLINLIWWE